METYGHWYFQRVASYEYLWKYYIKLLCYCFIFSVNNYTDKEHLKFNPCEYSSLSDYLICRLRYFLNDFVYHIPAKISFTFTFLIIFGKNTKKSVLTCKILSYLFDFRSSKCVFRRHTVSKIHLGLQLASSRRGWEGSTPESTCFILPLSCLRPLCFAFCFFLCRVCQPQELESKKPLVIDLKIKTILEADTSF